MRRLRSGQWLALTAGGLVLVALLGVAVSLLALHRLAGARLQVVDRVDPARIAAQEYLTALVDQETGIRGYAAGGTPDYLAPYDQGAKAAVRARQHLQRLADSGQVAHLNDDLVAVAAASTSWHLLYADPSILAIRADGPDSKAIPPITEGKQLFDQLRTAFAGMQRHLAGEREAARTRLHHAADLAEGAVIFTAVLILAAAVAAAITLRRAVALPLARLARDARQVARGEFGHVVAIEGPRDIRGLSTDVESMRRRIISELDSVNDARTLLEEQKRDLQRSNAELEQFAYVASHDLQEPLRKVASFTGMLQHRYHGQLDERADQYIDFAVDGAKRMQGLINDLLAFSRVGRVGTSDAPVEMDAAAADAVKNLEAAIEDAGARVEIAGPLPRVHGDRSLLTALLQNLFANAIKFRGEEAPFARLTAERTPAAAEDQSDMYTFTVSDNGIGVAPRYADRIFVIFQRLHPKEEYEGTGIGLAMCRKIVEFHGGTIWLEPEGAEGGATFRFTLPVPDEEPDA